MSDNTHSLNRMTRNRSTLEFIHLPNVSYMLTTWPLPGVDLPAANFSSPFFDMPVFGDKLEFQELEIEFPVTEYMKEWLEIFNWMYNLANPTQKQEISLTSINASMLLYTSHENPFMEVIFEDIVPISLGGLQFTEGTNQTSEITSNAVFRYRQYYFKPYGAN